MNANIAVRASVAAACLCISVSALAEAKLQLWCKVQPTATCQETSQRWMIPEATLIAQTKTGWKTFSDIQESEEILVCLDDIAPTSTGRACNAASRVYIPKCQAYGQVCSPPEANGKQFRLSWEHDRLAVDGTVADIKEFWIYSAGGTAALDKLQTVPGSINQLDIGGYGPGVYRFAVTAVNIYGQESDKSPAVEKTVGTARPTAPTLTVEELPTK